MNHEHPEHLLTPARSISLTDRERHALRASLISHMAAHPVRTGVFAVLGRHAFAYGVIAAVALIGGTTALADHAAPGSLLYPVRLAVNDRVAVAAAGDEDAQLDAELSQIDRMLNDEDVAGYDELSSEQDAEEQETLSAQDSEASQAGRDLDDIDRDLNDIEQDGPPGN